MTTPDARTLLQHNRELAILRHIAETLNRTTDLEAALDEALRSAVELLELQTAWVFLLDDNNKLSLAAWQALPPALALGSRAWDGTCNCNAMFRSGELQHAINIVHCSRLAEASTERNGLEFHASVPLRSAERMIGILNVASPGSEYFTPNVLETLSAIGFQLGTAIERVRLSHQAVRMAALEERNRLAREIHDTVAQGLTAITLYLEAAEAVGATDPLGAQRNVSRALSLARSNLEEVRRSVLDLRAAPLDDHTLPEALDMLLESFEDETGIATSLDVPASLERFPLAVEAAAYRIVQEALSNVRKHAAARTVHVALQRDAEVFHIQIADDGTGFDVESPAHRFHEGFGLVGMHERARLLGGHMELHSVPGAGTRIDIVIPQQTPAL
jgi:two-component system NarL family sensor kinase